MVKSENAYFTFEILKIDCIKKRVLICVDLE